MSLAKHLNLTPAEVTWRLYLPVALQYSHVILAGHEAWTVPLITEPPKAQAARLRAAPASDLLAL